ncbi:hypothetical protein SELR_00480 [Selenomonas ruminantium subsp. lactilytica TAM6421]|uniref:Carboxypeptidase regulatory-like domain-containing protein n=1 Tax=Selenomonas ruminantium subsp. lactilytica (strain NBRC 103574 / TAM6421) TaxID=927704 RepID=I0GLW9_SELRL|nr:prealbumin-like fold domain-containing protein [Selenomonas ruminantium]BAL81756.1 hypothetical protein SELR_00480 [Selenomonas ruminantium subsp. lactilytica TAM6421]
MKRIAAILAFSLLLSLNAIAAAAGSISGQVYLPNSERGMHVAKGESGAGMMWDMSAPKNRRHIEKADVWLIERSINLNTLPYADVQKWYQQGTIPANQPIYHAVTNEQGQFEFKDVPAANYYIMILDPNGQEQNQNLTEKMSRDELMQKLPHTDEFELFMVGMRSCLVQKITLHNGQNIKIRPGLLG